MPEIENFASNESFCLLSVMTTHAVIFDIDGTLLDSSAEDDRLYRDAARFVLGDVMLRSSLSDYDRVTDTGILLQIFEDNDIDPDATLVNAVKDEFFRRLEGHVVDSGPFAEMPGARSVVDRLQCSDRHQVAIATGGWRRSAEIKLSTAGFAVGNIPLATSDDAIQRTDIMLIALAALGEDFGSVTYYGDGRWDEQACAILGWSFRPVGPALSGISTYDDEFTIK